MRLKIAVSAVRFRPWPPTFAQSQAKVVHRSSRKRTRAEVDLSLGLLSYGWQANAYSGDAKVGCFCRRTSDGWQANLPARIRAAFLPRPSRKSRELGRDLQRVGLRHLDVRLDTDDFPPLHRIGIVGRRRFLNGDSEVIGQPAKDT